MTIVTEQSPVEAESLLAKVIVECNEPHCASFDTGHSEYAYDTDENCIIHEAGEVEGDRFVITTERCAWEADWKADIQIDSNDPAFTPAQATAFAAALLIAADQCEAFNK